jgi:hypothetical protein
MGFTNLNLGSAANDGTGDTLRAGGEIINENFGKAAQKELSNLSNVAINESLILATDEAKDLGSTAKKWLNLFVKTIGATATRVTKGWFTDLEVTNLPTINGGTLASALNLSGTNTGDQTLPTRDSLGLDTDDTPTFAGALLSGLTASQLVATDASKNLQSLAVATYPSLTELAYLKGVTSALQTQLDALQPKKVQFGTEITADADITATNHKFKTTDVNKSTAVTLTLKKNVFAVGEWFVLVQTGDGQFELDCDAEVTVPDWNKSAGKGFEMYVYCVDATTDANVFRIVGGVE